MVNSGMMENQILDQQNSEVIVKNIGGICLISTLLIVGVIGNLHVLVVFAFRMKPSNHRTFVCCLAVVDLIACVVSMPFTIFILTHPLTFDNAIACSIIIDLNYFLCSSCGLILVGITVDRYRKICHPLEWQLTNRVAKIVCMVAFGVSVGLSSPAFFMFGHNSVETRYPNITGAQCGTDDKYTDTRYPTIFNLLLMALASVAFWAVVVLYVLISRAMLNRGKLKYSGPSDRNRLEMNRQRRFSTAEAIISTTNILPNYEEQRSVSSKEYIIPYDNSSNNNEVTFQINVKNQACMHKETRRITVMFFIIVAVYVLSYIPNLILKVIAFINNKCFQNLTMPSAILFNIFNWFFFVNNVVNPVVYFFLDVKYRAELQNFYGKLYN